jgi:hypothetical protein
MNNINDIREGGLLELYVMQLCTPEQEAQVKNALITNPALQKEIAEISKGLENYALINAKPVPTALDKKILMSFKPATKIVTFNKWKIAAMAASLLFITTMAGLFYVNQQNKNLQSDIAVLKNNLPTSINNEELFLNSDLFKQADFKKIKLQSPNKTENVCFNVLYNAQTGKVYINSCRSPQLPAGKQYQLWALKNGVPYSLGAFNRVSKSNQVILLQQLIANPEKFAISIENEGGSKEPNPQTIEFTGEVKI